MSLKKKRQYLDFYEKYKIIPVLNFNDLNKKEIFKQRSFFYYKLGINPAFLKNKEVIEFGPGNGINAYYLIKKVKIKKITLVDNNPSSIINLKKNLKNFKNVDIKNIDLEKIKLKKKYDLVILENILPGLQNPKKVLTKFLKLCKPGGVLIFTLTDNVGIFFEKLRFVMSKKILDNFVEPNFHKRVNILSEFFKSHLNTLGTNIRPVDKWIMDNMLNIDWITKKKYFNLTDLYSIIKKTNNYLISGMSPRLGNDFQWYKSSNVNIHNKNIAENYKQNKINLLNINDKFDIKNLQANNNIVNYISSIIKIINKLRFNEKKNDNKNYATINMIINKLFTLIRKVKINSKTCNALREFNDFKSTKSKLKYFKSSWGQCTNQVAVFKI
jgi:ubiquinone/menaquinone biosynthesis C-methylase UbiE